MSKKNRTVEDETILLGDNLTFHGREAYKLLRANLLYSVKRKERNARVIGVTSSVHGEGKSLTTINLAYSLAEGGRKVLLIECDLRLPTLRKKMGLKTSAGLSNILAGIDDGSPLLHRNVHVKGLNVVLAGNIPPNPSELLGSENFENMINGLEEHYDFIILDLPPVGEVSDALVVSKVTDGMIIVVRQDYTRMPDLSFTVRQLEMVNAKVLGFVYNDASAKGGRYQYKYKKRGGYGYYSSHKG